MIRAPPGPPTHPAMVRKCPQSQSGAGGLTVRPSRWSSRSLAGGRDPHRCPVRKLATKTHPGAVAAEISTRESTEFALHGPATGTTPSVPPERSSTLLATPFAEVPAEVSLAATGIVTS